MNRLTENIEKCRKHIEDNNLDEYKVCNTPYSPFDDKYGCFGVVRFIKGTRTAERLTIDEFMERFGL